MRFILSKEAKVTSRKLVTPLPCLQLLRKPLNKPWTHFTVVRCASNKCKLHSTWTEKIIEVLSVTIMLLKKVDNVQVDTASLSALHATPVFMIFNLRYFKLGHNYFCVGMHYHFIFSNLVHSEDLLCSQIMIFWFKELWTATRFRFLSQSVIKTRDKRDIQTHKSIKKFKHNP